MSFTAARALAMVRRAKVVTMTAAGTLPSLVEAIAGEPVRGSWWGHPSGARIYDIASKLEASKEILWIKLVDGKLTLVHQDLWPALYRAVTDAHWRAKVDASLSPLARTLLQSVEAAGSIRMDALAKRLRNGRSELTRAKNQLEQTLRVFSMSTHTENGRHQTQLQTWECWAPRTIQQAATKMSFLEAAGILQTACAGRARALEAQIG